jgi:hypothetical protein
LAYTLPSPPSRTPRRHAPAYLPHPHRPPSRTSACTGGSTPQRLDDNPRLNASTGGWRIPPALPTSATQLRVLRLDNCSLVGPIPLSLGAMSGLQGIMPREVGTSLNRS